MKASEAKPFVGKVVTYVKDGWPRPRTGVVREVKGRNIIMEDDALWAPDISSMKLAEEPLAGNAALSLTGLGAEFELARREAE